MGKNYINKKGGNVMENQVIISIGREYGSGGHEVAEKLAERLQLPIYDRNLLDRMAEEKSMDGEKLKKYDEAPRRLLLSRTVRGYSNSPEENIAHMQFDFIKGKAESGESFVVVGRCSDDLLKEYEGLISIFVLGDMDKKIDRVMRIRNMTEEEAKAAIYRHDKKRKSYHNYYCSGKWGDSRCYDICVNSSKMGVDKTVDILETYIRSRMEN